MLSEVSSAIAAQGVNIETLCAYVMGGEANFMVVTSDNKKTLTAIQAKGCKVKEEEAVLVELSNKVGALKETGDKLKAAGIDLSYIYGSTCNCDCPCSLVFNSNDNNKAVEILNK